MAKRGNWAPSPKRLYAVELAGGKSHTNWYEWYGGVNCLKGKSPDFGDINNLVVISSHHPAETLRVLVTEEMKAGESDVTIEEITSTSLQGAHRVLTSLIQSYFLPYGEYPNIGDLND